MLREWFMDVGNEYVFREFIEVLFLLVVLKWLVFVSLKVV